MPAGYFSLNVPSGLTLYWFANNLITTAQQVGGCQAAAAGRCRRCSLAGCVCEAACIRCACCHSPALSWPDFPYHRFPPHTLQLYLRNKFGALQGAAAGGAGASASTAVIDVQAEEKKPSGECSR